jgi:transposase InsO family protein
MLQPLLVLKHLWQHLAIDFKLIAVDKYSFDAVFVMINQLSKQSISTPCHKTATAEDMACMFINQVYYYYKPPQTIVSDQGPQFILSFWTEFCRILGIQLKLSTAYYLQTNGQTEIINQYLNQRLCFFVNYF